MALTLAQAAQATGLNRSTVLRAIKSGRISGQRDDSGAWSVEPVELHRVFPPAAAMPKALPQDAQTDALVAELRAQLADMRAQRDAWQAEAADWKRQAQNLLPPPQPPPQQTTTASATGHTTTGNQLLRAWRWMRVPRSTA
jgi:hypothetical protein